MRRPSPRLLVWLYVLLVALLAARTLWTSIPSDFRRGLLAAHWQGRTVAWLEEHCFFGAIAPSQVAFQVGHVDRILAANPRDANLWMGAAWILDNDVQESRSISTYRSTDENARHDAERWEAICRARSQEAAARATSLRPDELRWWRLRAELCFGSDDFQLPQPRTPDWRKVLDECARHDPDNAAYDYLAAWHLLGAGTTIEWFSLGARVSVRDPATFAEGWRRLEQGQRKPFLAVESPATCLSHFVRQCEAVAWPESCYSRTMAALEYVGDAALRLQTEERVKEGKLDEGIAFLRQRLHLLRQVTVARPVMDSSTYLPGAWTNVLWDFSRFLERRDLIPPADRQKILAEYRALMLDAKIAEEARQRIAPPSRPLPDLLDILCVPWPTVPKLIATLAMLAGIAFATGFLLTRNRARSPSRLGLLRHTLTWLLGLVVTLVLFGLAPADVIPREAQQAALLVVLSVPILVALARLILRAYRRRFRFQLRTMFLFMLLAALVLGLLSPRSRTLIAVWWVEDAISSLHMPRHALGQGVDTTGAWIVRFLHVGNRVAREWIAYSGLLTTWLVAMLLAAVWYTRRSARQQGERLWQYCFTRKPERWAGMLRELGYSALAFAAMLLLVDLAITPSLMARFDRYRQEDRASNPDSEAYAGKLQAAIAAVKADPRLMASIGTRVSAETAFFTSDASKPGN